MLNQLLSKTYKRQQRIYIWHSAYLNIPHMIEKGKWESPSKE